MSLSWFELPLKTVTLNELVNLYGLHIYSYLGLCLDFLFFCVCVPACVRACVHVCVEGLG